MSVPCGCKKHCGDLPEHKDDPNAVCKELPLEPKPTR